MKINPLVYLMFLAEFFALKLNFSIVKVSKCTNSKNLRELAPFKINKCLILEVF
jgi:hypothetical protein